MLKRKTYMFVMLGLLSMLILTSFSYSEDINTNVYLNQVQGTFSNQFKWTELVAEKNGVFTEQGIRYDSDTDNLNAYLESNWDESSIRINWNGIDLIIKSSKTIQFIRWRPNYSGFIYSREEEYQGGDFGNCSLHYVELAYEEGKILVSERQISSNQVSTDVAWSSDGKYFVYSRYSSMIIKNFDSGQEWITKTIVIDDGKEQVEIIPDAPFCFVLFKWFGDDDKIYFEWKYHPAYDEYYGAEIYIDQFNLE